MGSVCSSSKRREEMDEARVNMMLQAGIDDDKQENDLKVKLLLLGTGDSGKSTLFKQMKINYMEDYNPNDLASEDSRIINAFQDSFAELVRTVLNHYSTLGDSELDAMIDHLLDNQGRAKKVELTPRIVQMVKKIWNSQYAKDVWASRSNYQLVDSLAHFCKDIDRLAKKPYIPTEEDYLLCRIRSTGIIEQTFTMNKVKFQIVDVGGQRSERRKWVQCFDGVTSVIFVAAISEFDQSLFEDNHVSRIVEAKTLFQKTLNFKVFKDTPVILFLNKMDLFRKKLAEMKAKEIDLDPLWPELKLGKQYDTAEQKIMDFYKRDFEGVAQTPSRVYTHFVTATDKALFDKVFRATAHIILSRTINSHFQGSTEGI